MISKFFDDFFPEWISELELEEKPVKKERDFFNSNGEKHWQPPTNIIEFDLGYVLLMEIPGLTRKDLNVQVEDGELIVDGSRQLVPDNKNGIWLRNEIRKGKFHRVFSLGENLDTENIQAKYELGVLKIYIPKKFEKNKI